MRLEWLEDILAVAETGSFSEAAERRHLTQSAFSRRIQNIEDFVGVELFDRTRKPVQLRPTTELQHDQILRLVGTLRQLVEDLRRGERIAANRIVVASQHSLTAAMAPGLVRRVQERQGDIYIRLRSANLDECFALLLSRQAEVALVYGLPDETLTIAAGYIQTIAIGTDRLIPVCRPDVTPKGWPDGSELPYIAYPGDVFFGQVIDREILPTLRRMASPVPRVETALAFAMLELAAAGLGIAWVPASLAAERIAAGRLADLSDRLPACQLNVMGVRLTGEPGKAERAVWELFQEWSASAFGPAGDA
ncbi:LysR substrate-binding domain-containing protein [Limibaculum sp. FT325]|uniref:LysR family transcriptional regulator n=1 Tax=Thermohalobaculum sediminis TaxID=2939436 RepID=UPI0020C056D7|nr:LysR family transcriptional regulator [Limibaculum sediminis]MCL5777566.1 LysR substrate-binding domain-containing protein [Limibaculum sediminis]